MQRLPNYYNWAIKIVHNAKIEQKNSNALNLLGKSGTVIKVSKEKVTFKTKCNNYGGEWECH